MQTYFSQPEQSSVQFFEKKQLAKLPVEDVVIDGVLHGQVGERPLECLKSKVPPIARNQLRLAVLQVHDRPKTVVFQLENVIRMVKGLPHQTEPHGMNASEHNSSLSLHLWMPAPSTRPALFVAGCRKTFVPQPSYSGS